MKALAYNVAALDKVLGLATQVGDSYKPGNASIERTALTALLEESRKSITAVLKAEGDLATAINQRQKAFDGLPLLGTHIMGIAVSGGMEEKDLSDLNRLRKRFRSNPFKTDLVHDAEEGSGSAPPNKVRMNRQLSFDNKVVTLESIIRFLEDKPAYNPTESEFSIDGLKETLSGLQAHNTAVIEAKFALSNIRGQAKAMIFGRQTGVFGKTRMTKVYLKTILGRDTDLYRSINNVKLKSL
ncbi:MAG TPA: hypothetical protein VD927_17240 [Chryseosolibacter sp.]|nr:hypothetical protein [Chryseosolibacter sp.]